MGRHNFYFSLKLECSEPWQECPDGYLACGKFEIIYLVLAHGDALRVEKVRVALLLVLVVVSVVTQAE